MDPKIERVEWNMSSNYMNYEYYPRERLVRKQKILQVMSDFFKEKIDLPHVMNSYLSIISENNAKYVMSYEEMQWFRPVKT